MPDAISAPLLSLRDDREASEGGIDPPGLYTIADALGVRLVPGVRERQSHPRFLTAIATSRLVGSDLEDELGFEEQDVPAWLAFEWYFVERQVRTPSESQDELRGLPGRLKAQQAKDERVPLSPRRYLKTPSVFGWHGIYRLLARTLGVETDYAVGEAGLELLSIWEREQGLNGFTSGKGEGGQLRRKLQDAVRRAVQKKATDLNWTDGNFFRDRLGIYNARPKEQQEIWRLLLNDTHGSRREVLEFLVSPSGQQIWSATLDGPLNERPFHAALAKTAGVNLRPHLEAIAAYETFSRLLQDAFDECVFRLSTAKSKTPQSALADGPAVQLASRRIPEVFAEVRERLDSFKESHRFEQQFQSLSEPSSPTDWLDRLVSHHRQTQSNKPPGGKASWFDHFDDGSLMIRPLYRDRTEGPRQDDSYVHAYRTASLWSFAQDLGKVPR